MFSKPVAKTYNLENMKNSFSETESKNVSEDPQSCCNWYLI